MKLFRILTVLSVIIFSQPALYAQTEVRFHNEESDTTRLTEMLDRASAINFNTPEQRVAYFAHLFEGTPYAAHTLEGEPEILTVNLDSLDCTTFVETVMALAYTVGENRNSWRDFVYNLRRLRYRGGNVDGYPSRLHYIADWAVDNIHRGNFSDATVSIPTVKYMVRSIDYMSANRDSYPALADSANYARIRSMEGGYRNHRFPYIKSNDVASRPVKNALRNGDVIAFVSSLRNLDVTHMGIVVKDSPTSEPYLIHASSTDGKVEVSSRSLAEVLRRNRQWIGIRVFRLNE